MLRLVTYRWTKLPDAHLDFMPLTPKIWQNDSSGSPHHPSRECYCASMPLRHSAHFSTEAWHARTWCHKFCPWMDRAGASDWSNELDTRHQEKVAFETWNQHDSGWLWELKTNKTETSATNEDLRVPANILMKWIPKIEFHWSPFFFFGRNHWVVTPLKSVVGPLVPSPTRPVTLR